MFVRPAKVDEVKAANEEINEMDEEIGLIYRTERVEREIRIATLEAKKAQNLMDFKDDIYNRPKREWIVSAMKREEIKEKMREKVEGADYKPRGEKHMSKDAMPGIFFELKEKIGGRLL